jgi:hypothetical protein
MISFLKHLLLPQETNNYRARLLHHKILLIFTLFFFSAGLLMSFVRTNYPYVLGTYSNISQDALLSITNQKRQEAGLSPLNLNGSLSQAAAGKAADMFAKNYWAHIAPDGTTPWVFIKGAGYNYVYAGENLARGFTTPSDVVNAWMASPSHRENMLSSRYSDVGFAAETGKLSGEDTVLVVEMFGSTSFATKTTNPQQPEPEKSIQVAATSPAPAPSASEPSPVPTIAQSQSNVSDNNPAGDTLAVQKINGNQNLVFTSLNQAYKPLVNGASFSMLSARIIISLFIFVLLLDMIIIERKKILRFVGHNLDHVIFFSLLLLVILILARGAIL